MFEDEERNFSGDAGSKEKERFEALMREAGPRIYTLAVRLTGNGADGQDLAAETFVRAYKGFSSFRGDAAFGTWTYRICVNLWKNRLRAQKRRRFWSHFSLGPSEDGEDVAPLDPPATEPGLDRPLEDAERKRHVEKALNQLGAEDRAILVMREIEDKSYEEIASLLGVALGTIKSRLARARGKLRLLLEPLMKDAP